MGWGHSLCGETRLEPRVRRSEEGFISVVFWSHVPLVRPQGTECDLQAVTLCVLSSRAGGVGLVTCAGKAPGRPSRVAMRGRLESSPKSQTPALGPPVFFSLEVLLHHMSRPPSPCDLKRLHEDFLGPRSSQSE